MLLSWGTGYSQAMKSENDAGDASPMKSAREELDFLRKVFRDTIASYSARVEGEIARIREAAAVEEKKKKAEKGRRRDLKKIDLLIEELNRFVENW